MEWFRWYAGTFSDPKFQWVAVKTCNTVAAVLAMWVAVLERANSNEVRGCCGGLDFESLDVALGLEDGAAHDIYQALIRKGMIIDDDMVAAWEKRQPKREDESAADRKREQRERDKLRKENEQLRLQLEASLSLSQSPESQPVTQCHAMSHDVTTDKRRLEEKREEENLKSKSSSSPTPVETATADPPVETGKAMMTLDVFRSRFLTAAGKHLPGGSNEQAVKLCRRYPRDALEAAFGRMCEFGGQTVGYLAEILEGKPPKARASPRVVMSEAELEEHNRRVSVEFLGQGVACG